MRALILLLAVCLAVVAGAPGAPKMVGGSLATIEQYPFAAALLVRSAGTIYSQSCGGAVINNRCILTAAQCFRQVPSANDWRIRVGSSYASSGGTVHNTATIITHPDFDRNYLDNDIGLIHSATAFASQVSPGSIAGTNYNVDDNQVVWSIGWNTASLEGPDSDQLRHMQIWLVNHTSCRDRYNILAYGVTDNMLCSGWLDEANRDECQGDPGSPLLHNNVVIGIYSWGIQCTSSRYPAISARVSRYTAWIQSNA